MLTRCLRHRRSGSEADGLADLHHLAEKNDLLLSAVGVHQAVRRDGANALGIRHRLRRLRRRMLLAVPLRPRRSPRCPWFLSALLVPRHGAALLIDRLGVRRQPQHLHRGAVGPR